MDAGDPTAAAAYAVYCHRLRKYVEQRGERQAVLWNNHKWSIEYRLVMPGGAVAKQIANVTPKHGA